MLHKNSNAYSNAFFNIVKPVLEGLAIAVECVFSWNWLADWCADQEIGFVLGHTLYMKAIHDGKAKNDKFDSEKVAQLRQLIAHSHKTLNQYKLPQCQHNLRVPDFKQAIQSNCFS